MTKTLADVNTDLRAMSLPALAYAYGTTMLALHGDNTSQEAKRFSRQHGEELAELRRRDEAVKALVEAARNLTCPRDTNGDGDCGRPGCPVCGKHSALRKALEQFK